jgi:biopolymer transport protein ExbB
MPMLQKEHDNHFFFSFFRYLVGLGTVAGMIKAFGALAAVELLIKQLLQVFLKLINTATGIGTSAVAIISQFLYFKIDDLTYSIDEAAVSIVNTTEDSEEV